MRETTDPLHLLPEEVVDAVAALPLEPRVVTEDGQVAHEALRHRRRRCRRAGVAGRRRGRLPAAPAACGSTGRRHLYLHDGVRALFSRGRQEAKKVSHLEFRNVFDANFCPYT